MRRFYLIVAIVMAFCGGLQAAADTSSADGPHVHVQLAIPQDQLYPGGANAAGLYFKLEPGWHVYWKNAGDAGEPPHIQWTLPAGVTAGPMQFPAPKRLPVGPLMDFGYENEVLFPLTFAVAPTVKDGRALIDAHVDWLVCREVCIPGKAELKATLQLSSGKPPVEIGSATDAELFKRLAATLPTPLPANSKVVFQPTQDGFRLGVETGQRETHAEFFPADDGVLSYPAPQKVTPTAKGVVLELKKDASLAANPAKLNGVLELAGGRAFDVTALPGTVAIPATGSLGLLARAAALAFRAGVSWRAAAEPDAVRVSGVVLERAFARKLWRRGAAHAARAWVCVRGGDSGFVLGAGGGAACTARGGRVAGLGIPVSIAGVFIADGGAAVLSCVVAGGSV